MAMAQMQPEATVQEQAMAMAQMQPEATVQEQEQVQVSAPPAPLTPLDDGRGPLALDPAIAAAVAAYRLGNGALGVSTNKTSARWSEPDADVSAVGGPRPVDLDPQDGSGNAQRGETARDAALALAANKALTAAELANSASSTPKFRPTPNDAKT
jgi:hypothetical protein